MRFILKSIEPSLLSYTNFRSLIILPLLEHSSIHASFCHYLRTPLLTPPIHSIHGDDFDDIKLCIVQLLQALYVVHSCTVICYFIFIWFQLCLFIFRYGIVSIYLLILFHFFILFHFDIVICVLFLFCFFVFLYFRLC
jgi:hypothetical protein